MLRRVSNWHWLLAARPGRHLRGARKHVVMEDEERFKRRWKQVELLDARDLYMMLFGRSRTVLSEIDIPAEF